MLVKFFRHGKGGSSGVMNYMLGAKNDRENAFVLDGDRELISMHIDSIKTERKYTSGVLSFEEQWDSVTEEKKREIMHDFEKTIFPGMQREQYNIMWIEHRDKGGRLELNFVIPRQELLSGKSFNPYYHRKDNKRVDSWKNIINYKYGFSDPNSPLKKRKSVNFGDYGVDETKELLERGFLEKLEEKNGRLTRFNYLESYKDLTIERTLDNSITVSIPQVRKSNSKHGKRGDIYRKKIRLTGEIWERNYNYEPPKKLTAEDVKEEDNRGQYLQKINFIHSKHWYTETMQSAAEWNNERYPPRPQQAPQLVAEVEEQKNAPQPRSRGMRF